MGNVSTRFIAVLGVRAWAVVASWADATAFGENAWSGGRRSRRTEVALRAEVLRVRESSAVGQVSHLHARIWTGVAWWAVMLVRGAFIAIGTSLALVAVGFAERCGRDRARLAPVTG